MTPERWQAVGELFARALAEPAATREAWLAAVAAPEDVRAEVAALLAAHEDDDTFLETPPAEALEVLAAPAADAALVAGATIRP